MLPPHTGQSLARRNAELRHWLDLPSNSRSSPAGVSIPLNNLMASSACKVPITPTTGPTTPAVRQLRSGSSVIWPQAAVTPLLPWRRQYHQLTAKSDRAGGDKRRVEYHAGGINLRRVAILSVQSSTTSARATASFNASPVNRCCNAVS